MILPILRLEDDSMPSGAVSVALQDAASAVDGAKSGATVSRVLESTEYVAVLPGVSWCE